MVLDKPVLYISSFITHFCRGRFEKNKHFFSELVRDLFKVERVGFLESYYVVKRYGRNVEYEMISRIEDLKKEFGDRVSIMIDSGAYSLYQKYVVKGRRVAGMEDSLQVDYSWVDSYGVKQYFSEYMEWLKRVEREGLVDEYVTLDIIGNPQLTWRNWLVMKENGLSPMNVIHSGAGVEWLEKFLSYSNGNGVRLGIGGVRQSEVSSHYWLKVLVEWLEKNVSFDNVRTHGFAVSNLDFAIKFKFWSVDTANWVVWSNFGKVYWFSQVRGVGFSFKLNKYIGNEAFSSGSDCLLSFVSCIRNDRELREEFFSDIEKIFELVGVEGGREVVKKQDIVSVLDIVRKTYYVKQLLSAIYLLRRWDFLVKLRNEKGGE